MLDAITDSLFSAMAWFVEMLAAAMAGFVGWILETVFSVTDPNLSAGFVWLWMSRTFTIAVPLTGIFMAAQIMTASVRARQVSGVKEALVGSAIAIIGTMVALPFIQMIVVAIDGLADAFLSLIQADITDFGATISNFLLLSQSPTGQELLQNEKANANAAAAAPGGGLVLLLVSVVIGIIGAFFLAFALLLRTNLLYIAIVALPIALAALAFEPTRGWPRKILSAIVALAFGKLAIVIVIGLGIAALQDSVWDAESVSSLIGGVLSTAALLLVAAFMPVLAFRFFDFVGGEALSAASGAGSAAVGAVASGGKMLTGAVAAGTAALTGGASLAAAGAASAGASAGGAAGGGAAAGSAGSSAAQAAASGGAAAGSAGAGGAGSPTDSSSGSSPAHTSEGPTSGGGTADGGTTPASEAPAAGGGSHPLGGAGAPVAEESSSESAPLPVVPVVGGAVPQDAAAAAMARDNAASLSQAAPVTEGEVAE